MVKGYCASIFKRLAPAFKTWIFSREGWSILA